MCIELSSGALCGDINNQCINKHTFDCYFCAYDSCLDSMIPSRCIPLVDTCQSNKGICFNKYSGYCVSCPEKSCLDVKAGNCIDFRDINLQGSQCLLFDNFNLPCKFTNMNVVNVQQTISNHICAQFDNQCSLISNNLCVRCPNDYIYIGDNICISISN
jgi:hypothetical protein